MSRMIVLEPAVSYGGNAQIAKPPPQVFFTEPIDPVCRYIDPDAAGNQTVIPPITSTG